VPKSGARRKESGPVPGPQRVRRPAPAGDLRREIGARIRRLREEWVIANHRYTAASMAATGTTFSLGELTTSAAWNAHSDSVIVYQYHEAAQLAYFMRADLGASLTTLLDQIGQGQPFETAYQAVSGRTFSTFTATYIQRLRTLAPTYPGVVTTPKDLNGPGLGIFGYGFTPSSAVTVSVSGGGRGSGTFTADAYGVVHVGLDASYPPGGYVVTASGPNGSASTSGVKTASAFDITPTGSRMVELLTIAPPLFLR